MEMPFARNLEVDISENGPGISDSYAIGGHSSGPVVPTSILCPADLKGVDRIKVQVSMDNSTFYDIQDEEGALITLALTVDRVVVIPSIIQVAVLGWAYMRLVTLDGVDAVEDPSADITFAVRFGYAPEV